MIIITEAFSKLNVAYYLHCSVITADSKHVKLDWPYLQCWGMWSERSLSFCRMRPSLPRLLHDLAERNWSPICPSCGPQARQGGPERPAQSSLRHSGAPETHRSSVSNLCLSLVCYKTKLSNLLKSVIPVPLICIYNMICITDREALSKRMQNNSTVPQISQKVPDSSRRVSRPSYFGRETQNTWPDAGSAEPLQTQNTLNNWCTVLYTPKLDLVEYQMKSIKNILMHNTIFKFH